MHERSAGYFDGPSDADLARIESQELPLLEKTEINDHLGMILNSIPNVESLSVEESARLGKTIKTGRKPDGTLTPAAKMARNRMIYSCKGMAMKMAVKYTRPEMETADLFQEGLIGLQKAAEKFDPSRNVKFVTFAYWDCRREIQRALKKTNKEQVVRSFTDEITDSEEAEGRGTLLDNSLLENAVFIQDPDGDDVDNEEVASMRQKIAAEIKKVEMYDQENAKKNNPTKFADVLKQRIGLKEDGTWGEALSQADLGDLYGVSATRIGQLQVAAMRRVTSREVHAVLMTLLFPNKPF